MPKTTANVVALSKLTSKPSKKKTTLSPLDEGGVSRTINARDLLWRIRGNWRRDNDVRARNVTVLSVRQMRLLEKDCQPWLWAEIQRWKTGG